MVCKSHNKQLKTNLTINLSNQVIQNVDKTKFLGMNNWPAPNMEKEIILNSLHLMKMTILFNSDIR